MEAGGGKAGAEAVVAAYERIEKSLLAEQELTDSFNASLRTTGTQADLFNTEMQKSALQLQTAIYPALMDIAPSAVALAKGMAGAAGWLIGPDAASRRDVNTAAGDVDTDLANTGKQLAQGMILPEQEAKNKQDEKLLRETAARARAEADLGKDDEYSGLYKTLLKAGDYTPGGALGNLFTGKKAGASAVERNEQQQVDRRDRAKLAEEKLDEISKTNQRVAELLSEGLIIKRMPAPIPGAKPHTSGTSDPNASF